MKTLLAILLAALAACVQAQPMPETQESTLGFKSFDLPAEQTGRFEVSFDATPLKDKIDGFTGVSAAEPRTANDVAAMVRFNDEGKIDVRNGNAFRADQVLGYSANKTYRVRMVIDVAARTYSVHVTPAGQAEVALAANYAFRTPPGGAQGLRKLVLAGFKGPNGFFAGAHRIAAVAVKPASER